MIKQYSILNEIKNWQQFEDLCSSYFDNIRDHGAFNRTIIKSNASIGANGPDGGRDILADWTLEDPLRECNRRFVIQCKFYKKTLGLNEISEVNIPGLVHSYKANGYLLICKERVTTQVQDFFEKLNLNCKFNYEYIIWDGSKFEENLIGCNNENLYKHYFPKHFSKMKKTK